jgi:hypothetical protein
MALGFFLDAMLPVYKQPWRRESLDGVLLSRCTIEKKAPQGDTV